MAAPNCTAAEGLASIRHSRTILNCSGQRRYMSIPVALSASGSARNAGVSNIQAASGVEAAADARRSKRASPALRERQQSRADTSFMSSRM